MTKKKKKKEEEKIAAFLNHNLKLNKEEKKLLLLSDISVVFSFLCFWFSYSLKVSLGLYFEFFKVKPLTLTMNSGYFIKLAIYLCTQSTMSYTV